MTLKVSELEKMANTLASGYSEEIVNKPDQSGRHREVQILSRDWWMDFCLGLFLGQFL